MPPTIILGVLCLVALTVLGIWYVNRRLKAVEAKVKVEYGLSADRVRDMNRLTADVNEVRHSVGLLAHEMGLRFERKNASVTNASAKETPATKTAPQVTEAPKPQASKAPQTAAPEAAAPDAPNTQPSTPQVRTAEAPEVKVAEAPQVQPEVKAAEAPQPAAPQPEAPQVAGVKPQRSAVKGKGGKGKIAGKGKRAIVFDLFPEFIGPPLPEKEGNGPRVEEVNDTDTECEGGVCPIPGR